LLRNLVLGLLLGALFLALAFWGVPMDELGEAFAAMHVGMLVAITLVTVLHWVLRGWRQLLLVRAVAPATTFRVQLAILSIGFFCISTFPARLGEIVRPYLLHEREDVPFGAGFGVFFLERVIDLIAVLVILLGIALFAPVPDRALEFAGQSIPLGELARRAAFVVLAPVLAAFVILALFGRPLLRVGASGLEAFERRCGGSRLTRLGRALLGFAESFVEALHTLRSPSRGLGVAALTVGVWTSAGWMVLLVAQAFDLGARIGLAEGMGVLAIIGVGIALPAPPGFAGVFEASARAGLALFGVHGDSLDARALACALVIHWWPYLILTAVAAYFLWRDGIELGRVFRFARSGSAGPA
jgi:uncharacterized protein (TIRG00374 family)